jgi:predicted alpha/beta-hydrolase family hydrolase
MGNGQRTTDNGRGTTNKQIADNTAMSPDDLLIDGPEDAAITFVFAHGAGAGMDSGFMARVARALGQRGIRVVRFEFPYMAARRKGGRRGAPDREPVLRSAWSDAVAALRRSGRLLIGGKSMGGRIASLVADSLEVDGLICFGYPFHPPGRPEKLRTAHLAGLSTPALIIQGTRDQFGSREDIAAYELAPTIAVHWIEDGDHSFKPRASSGRSESVNVNEAIEVAAAFLKSSRQ